MYYYYCINFIIKKINAGEIIIIIFFHSSGLKEIVFF